MIEQLSGIFPSFFEFFSTCLIFVIAEMIYMAMGFGAGLIAVGTLALVLPDVQDAVVMLLLVNLPVEMVVVWSSRNRLKWKGLFYILAGIFAGILGGTWILKFGTPTFILAILGYFLIFSGSFFALIPQKGKFDFPIWSQPLVGMVSGILAGLFGTGGPPLIYYFQLKGIDKTLFRSSLMAIFLTMAFVRLPAYSVSGLITVPRLMASLVVFPMVLVGVYLGHKTHISLSENTFKRLVGIILAAIGLLLILK